jgi:hypothetical protein
MHAWREAIAGWLMMALVGAAGAQPAVDLTAVRETVRVAAAAAEAPSATGGNLLREIPDPSTGELWLLLRDPARPAAPGRLVLARQRGSDPDSANPSRPQPLSPVQQPVIHTGDALTVEEHTAVVDLRLQAVALGPAAEGAYFRVRLKIGGKVLRVQAVSPGHAALGPESEVEP